MNFATPFQFNSFTFPAWAETTIRHTLQAAAQSRVILQALHKSFTPQLLTTFKDLSHYYVKCGEGAGAWAMTRAGITHNPIQAAVHAAHAELTSAEAQATYRRLRHIIHESAMDGLIIGLCGVVAVSAGIEIAQAGYRAAAQFYRVIYERLNPSTSPSAGIAIASTELAAALAAVADVAEADIQAKGAELLPDFWTEPPSVISTPPAPEPVAKPKRSRRKPETQPQQRRKPAAKPEGVKAKPRSRAKAKVQ